MNLFPYDPLLCLNGDYMMHSPILEPMAPLCPHKHSVCPHKHAPINILYYNNNNNCTGTADTAALWPSC
jgi:hypothetical protein